MLVKVNIEDMTGRQLAHDKQAVECICEVGDPPSCAYAEVDEIPTTYLQRVYPDWAGESLTYAQIQELDRLKADLTDEEFAEIGNIKELKLTVRLKQEEQRGVERDLVIFEILANGGV